MFESLESRRLLSVSLSMDTVIATGAFGGDGAQQNAVATLGATGGLMAYTANNATGGSGLDIIAKRLDASGTPTGSAFFVNSTLSGNQNNADVAVTPDGAMSVIWSDGSTVMFRGWAANGTPGADTVLITNTVGPAKLATAADGTFAVVYTDSADSAIKYQRFNAAGVVEGSAIEVVAASGSLNYLGDAVIDNDGKLLVAWRSLDTSTFDSSAQVRAFDADDVASTTLTLAADSYQLPTLAITPDGHAAATYLAPAGSRVDVWFTRLSMSGTIVGTPITVSGSLPQISNYHPTVAASTSGAFAVQWNEYSTGLIRNVVVASNAGSVSSVGTVMNGSGAYTSGLTIAPDLKVSFFQASNAAVMITGQTEPVLHVDGTTGDDTITFGTDVNGLPTAIFSGVAEVMPAVGSKLIIDTGDGDDRVTLPSELPGMFASISISTGSGDDRVIGSDATETIDTGDGRDYVYANGGDDVIFTGGGADHVWAGAGRDRVKAGAGNDFIYGGEGVDTLYGDGGNDRLHGEAAGNRLYGGAGDDLLVGHIRDDSLYGQDGNDILQGGKGVDHLDGGAGDDIADTSLEDSSLAIEVVG